MSQGVWYAGPSADALILTTEPWPVRIVNKGGVSTYLFAEQRFTVAHVADGPHAGQWKVKTLSYAYALSDTPSVNDAWIHWHWHPPKRENPHLHITVDLPDMTTEEGVRGHHVPTGRVSFEALIRYLLDDCDVEPRAGGGAILDENEELFRRYRSWS